MKSFASDNSKLHCLMVLTFQARLGEMSTEGAPHTRTGKLKEEAGRPANYLAKTMYIFDFYGEAGSNRD